MPPLHKKVLVVDDDPDILDIISLILREEGYEVIELNSGRDVINIVQNIRPDLVLLDVMLGDMDGREICAELKNTEVTSNIPIIIVSATHGWQSILEKNCRADKFIEKPFDIPALLGSVKRYAA